MKLVRRVFAVMLITLLGAAGLRLQGTGGSPPQRGGWRPLDLPPADS